MQSHTHSNTLTETHTHTDTHTHTEDMLCNTCSSKLAHSAVTHTHTSHIPSCVCVFLGPFLCQTEELFHTRRCSDSELKQVMLSFAVELGSDGSGLGLWSAVNHVGLFGTGSRSGVCIRSSALLSGSISQTARPHSHQLNKRR